MSVSIETYLARLYLHTDAPRAPAGDSRRESDPCASDTAAPAPIDRVASVRRSWLARLLERRRG